MNNSFRKCKTNFNNSKKMNSFHVILLFFVFFSACNNTTEQEEQCSKGQPTPIFSSELVDVISQKFELDGQNSLETIAFKNGNKLELAQSGCEDVVQEFQFTIPSIQQKSETVNWVEAGIEQFRFLSGLDEKYTAFFMWGNAIEESKDQIAFNIPHQLGPGFFVTFNKVSGNKNDILIVKLHSN